MKVVVDEEKNLKARKDEMMIIDVYPETTEENLYLLRCMGKEPEPEQVSLTFELLHKEKAR